MITVNHVVEYVSTLEHIVASHIGPSTNTRLTYIPHHKKWNLYNNHMYVASWEFEEVELAVEAYKAYL